MIYFNTGYLYLKKNKMKTILVPTDFSANADKACQYAIALAKDLKAKIILMHAFETPTSYTNVSLMTIQMDYATIHNLATNKLKNYYKKISKTSGKVEIQLVVQQGLASARIQELALEKKVDLIVMGTVGADVVERFLIGSNTTRTIRNAPCMVLAIPPKAKYKGLKKMVYTTDLTAENLNHANALVPLAKNFNAEIIFLNVNNQFIEYDDEDFKQLKTKIKHHIKYPKTSSYICTELNVVSGIDFFMKNHKADCLVIYTHHRTLLQSAFSYSIAKSLSFHTTVPLLIIHENDHIAFEQIITGKSKKVVLNKK